VSVGERKALKGEFLNGVMNTSWFQIIRFENFSNYCPGKVLLSAGGRKVRGVAPSELNAMASWVVKRRYK